jgi:putative peptidoglycan lipid II flippase
MTAHAAMERETSTGVVVRATAVASGLTVLGALLGLVRDLMLASYFGASAETDAFLVAWTVPETASPLLIEGAMAYLMVPLFVRALAERGTLTGAVRETLSRLTWILVATSASVAVAAPLLVRVLAPGLAEPDLAVRSMRIVAVTVLTFGVAGYMGAALRASHVFGWPAAIYTAYNVGIIGSIVALHRPLGCGERGHRRGRRQCPDGRGPGPRVLAPAAFRSAVARL